MSPRGSVLLDQRKVDGDVVADIAVGESRQIVERPGNHTVVDRVDGKRSARGGERDGAGIRRGGGGFCQEGDFRNVLGNRVGPGLESKKSREADRNAVGIGRVHIVRVEFEVAVLDDNASRLPCAFKQRRRGRVGLTRRTDFGEPVQRGRAAYILQSDGPSSDISGLEKRSKDPRHPGAEKAFLRPNPLAPQVGAAVTF